ncbi:MAG TPA: dockerin type I domain-containing protein [Planctomycetota bacterium]|nr:dockerin type I domain-containing protein [Planctomycetota bacterium]
MKRDAEQNPGETQPEANTRLTEDLGRLFTSHFEVPEAVDASIRARIQRHFGAGRHVRRVLRWLPLAAAAAAVLLVAFVTLTREKQQPTSTTVTVREDVDHSGAVDILDAFALARMIEDRVPDTGRWDLNADGIVDRSDVDVVALAAVSLREGKTQ